MKTRLLLIKIIMILSIIYGFIGAFIAHWFFPNFYMLDIMGFANYQDSLLKLLGISGILTSLLSFFVFINPVKNKDIIISLIIYSFLMGVSFIYFILRNDFPKTEYINAAALIIISILLLLIYPWKHINKKFSQ